MSQPMIRDPRLSAFEPEEEHQVGTYDEKRKRQIAKRERWTALAKKLDAEAAKKKKAKR